MCDAMAYGVVPHTCRVTSLWNHLCAILPNTKKSNCFNEWLRGKNKCNKMSATSSIKHKWTHLIGNDQYLNSRTDVPWWSLLEKYLLWGILPLHCSHHLWRLGFEKPISYHTKHYFIFIFTCINWARLSFLWLMTWGFWQCVTYSLISATLPKIFYTSSY